MGFIDWLFGSSSSSSSCSVLSPKPPQIPLNLGGLGGSLRPFQIEGVSFLVDKKRAILGDEMGLGKTVQALAAVNHLAAYPTMIVCPANLKLMWEEEVLQWLPGKSTQVLRGIHPSDLFANVVILNYEIAWAWERTLLAHGFSSAVADEAHALKEPKSNRTLALGGLLRTLPVVFLLSGTPIVNDPKEFASLLSYINWLKDRGGYTPFFDEYCGHDGDKYAIRPEKLDALNQVLRASCYIRREKAEVLPELPRKQSTVLRIDLENAREYAEVLDRLRRGNDNPLVLIEKMRGIVGRGKLKAVLAWIENFLHSGEKLVVFATHVDVQRAIYERFKAQSVLLTGEVGIKLRKLAVTKFQTDPGVRLAVCSIKAAGVGVTLTAASNVLFAELDWTPAAHDQAADRVHRIGQRSAVNIWYIVARGTIDDRMMTLVQDKRNVTGVAISGRQAKRNVLASVRG